MKKIVAVTACPTGIAHTFMAAEALEEAAKKRDDVEIKVETRGAEGVEDELTDADIAEADAVIIAADTDVKTKRFSGTALISVAVGDAIDDAPALIDEALAKAEDYEPSEEDLVSEVKEEKEERSSEREGVYKHLMNGVSRMIPFVVAGGLAIALAFAVGGIHMEGALASALGKLKGAGFTLMVPILAGFIASSIADRPGLAPGMIGGYLANDIGAGFLGGIVAGFLAGYVTKWLKDTIQLPKTMQGLKPVLILPLLSTLIVGLLMIFVIGSPMGAIMEVLKSWLEGLTGTNRILLGAIIGAMMAFDMGGPVNKAAYTFGAGLLASEASTGPIIMAAVMAAGMTPPLGLALATFIAPDKFDEQQHEAGKAAAVLGISFVTEGAIPFAAADPIKIIPSIMTGSAVAGALSMLFQSTLQAPHGGIFVLAIPGAVGNLVMYGVSIIAGTVVTALLVSMLKNQVQ